MKTSATTVPRATKFRHKPGEIPALFFSARTAAGGAVQTTCIGHIPYGDG